MPPDAFIRTHAGSAEFGLRNLRQVPKLIHGGLLYSEHWGLRLVSEALAERGAVENGAAHRLPDAFSSAAPLHLRRHG